MTKRELLWLLQPFVDDIEIDIEVGMRKRPLDRFRYWIGDERGRIVLSDSAHVVAEMAASEEPSE